MKMKMSLYVFPGRMLDYLMSRLEQERLLYEVVCCLCRYVLLQNCFTPLLYLLFGQAQLNVRNKP